MKKIAADFLTKIKKLTNYLVMYGDTPDDYVILATDITITQHIEKRGVFSHYEDNIDKTFTVIFIIVFNDRHPDIQKFKNFPVPILTLNKDHVKLSTEDLKNCLDDFVNKIKS